MTCGVSGCPRTVRARGWCGTHYQRWRRMGNADPDWAWERFIRKVDASGDCWEWTGGRTRGYGTYQAEGHHMAHRFIWTRLVGPIPEGLTLDHLCRNKACVNPDHLEVVSLAENLYRAPTLAAINIAKTHCKHGHPFNAENTYRYGGERRCRTCANRAKAQYLDRQRATVNP